MTATPHPPDCECHYCHHGVRPPEPAQGWEWCEGSDQLGLRVDQKWLRCPVCKWVGFRTTKGQIQPVQRHQRPSIDGQLSLLE